jgi:hypothetical protein
MELIEAKQGLRADAPLCFTCGVKMHRRIVLPLLLVRIHLRLRLITPKLVPSQQAFPKVFTGATPDPVHVVGVVAGVAVLDDQDRRLDAVVMTAAGLEPGLLRPRGGSPRVLRCGVIREMGQLIFAGSVCPYPWAAQRGRGRGELSGAFCRI